MERADGAINARLQILDHCIKGGCWYLEYSKRAMENNPRFYETNNPVDQTSEKFALFRHGKPSIVIFIP